MTRVMAQGTFDILHPGHLHYLQESAALGDELVVVIARDSRMKTEKPLVMDEESRRIVVEALRVVDRAVLGSEDSIFDTVDRIVPDVVTLGYDQDHDESELRAALARHGHPDVAVERIGPWRDGAVSSTRFRRGAHDDTDVATG